MNRRFYLSALGTIAIFCTAELRADSFPNEGLVNFETPHVSPIALTPDGTKLLAVNTPAAELMVYNVTATGLTLASKIPVGFDPVTVRARTNTEAWVVNQVSDSVSIVDLGASRVTATLRTDNEPADVVFAGTNRAFVSCMEPNRVLVFSTTNLAVAPTRIDLLTEEPRAMAVSQDGSRVFVAGYRTGNSTTVLNGRLGPIGSGLGLGSENVVSRPEGPYAGRNPVPNRGNDFVPPITNPNPPPQSIIVKKDSQNRWMDDNNGDWSIFVSGALASTTRRTVGWDAPDRDVAVIDANTLAVSYQSRLMNVLMAIAVNPSNGQVTVVGTEALNHVRFEPNLKGVFLRVNLGRFSLGGTNTISDLNPHLTYTTSTIPASQRAQSLGDPRALAWVDGSTGLVAGMGSNNVAVINASGQRLATIPVGEGPTGIAVHGASGRAFVMNKFGGSISVLNIAARSEATRVAFSDPTPAAIKAGRVFLYNTHRTSGLGHISCASCHVDGKTDHLSWDLGNPSGANERSGDGVTLHPMKGPMLTQSLQDIIRFPSLHWRGDRPNIEGFNGAFVGLMGAESPLTAGEMAAFRAHLDTIHFPPNPNRNLDNSLPTSIRLPDGRFGNAAAGRAALISSCFPCHMNGRTRNLTTSIELSQRFVPPAFHGFLDRLGYQETNATSSTNAFGFFHDGADPIFPATRGLDFTAALLTFEGPGHGLTGNLVRKDSHPAVGRQVTVTAANASTTQSEVQTLLNLTAASVHISVIAFVRINGVMRGFASSGGDFISDKAGDNRSLAQLFALATAGEPVTFTVVPRGTGTRMATDKNNNGVKDQDENAPPVVTNPGNRTTERGQNVALQIQATDPEGAPLSYSATGLPLGLSIQANTGLISGTVSTSAAGTNNVNVSVSDGANTVSVSFVWATTAPSTNLPTPADCWPLDEISGTLATNIIRPRHGIHQGGVLVNQAGAIGKSAFYDGIDDHTEIPPLNNTSTSVTMLAFVKRSGDQEPASPVFYSRSAQTDVGFFAGNDNDLRYIWQGTYWQFAPPTPMTLPNEQWCLAAVVVEPNKATMYLRTAAGMQSATNIAPHGLQPLEDIAHIGWDRRAPERHFRGWIDDVRFYRTALSEAQIDSIWTSVFGGATNRAPNITNPGSQTSSRGFAVTLQIQASDPDGNSLTYSATGLPAGLSLNAASGLISGTVSNAAANSNNVTISVSDGALTASVNFTWTIATSTTLPVPTDRWTLDEASGLTAVNSVRASKNGVHRHGTAVNQDGAGLNTGKAIRLDGIDDVTEIPPLNYDTSNMSFLVWVKRDGEQNEWSQFFYSRSDDTDAGFGVGDENELRYIWEGGNWRWAPAVPLTLPDNQWALAALVVTPNAATLHLRTATGLRSATNTAPHAKQPFEDISHIGWDRGHASRHFKGWLDDLRIFPVALTAAQIEQFYQDGQTSNNIVNSRPDVQWPGHQTTPRGTAVNLVLRAWDSDGDPLTLSAEGLPTGLTLQGNRITGNPIQVGTSVVRLTVSDGRLSETEIFDWIVTERDSGVTGTYFSGVNFNTQILQRVDPNMNFNWGTGSPAANVPADFFSVRWTGCLIPQFSETYRFYIVCDQACRLFMNNQLILDNWLTPVQTEVSGQFAMTAGIPVPFRLEFYEQTGNANISVWWSSPSQTKQPIPQSRIMVNETTMPGAAILVTKQEDLDALAEIAKTDLKRLQSSMKIVRTANPILAGHLWDLEFTRPIGLAPVYQLEASEDLKRWDVITDGSFELTPLGNGLEKVIVPDISRPAVGNPFATRYFRMRVSSKAP